MSSMCPSRCPVSPVKTDQDMDFSGPFCGRASTCPGTCPRTCPKFIIGGMCLERTGATKLKHGVDIAPGYVLEWNKMSCILQDANYSSTERFWALTKLIQIDDLRHFES